MLGSYDFCAHYEWTFEWFRQRGGEELVTRYWDEAIYRDSQQHATSLIVPLGFEGMAKYWDHTLAEEGALFTAVRGPDYFRFDMTDCPSKGFLIRNGLVQYHDYCDHCMGWIEPLMRDAGFGIDHEHNHNGQCWWEFRKTGEPGKPTEPGEATPDDVRLKENWESGNVQRFTRER